ISILVSCDAGPIVSRHSPQTLQVSRRSKTLTKLARADAAGTLLLLNGNVTIMQTWENSLIRGGSPRYDPHSRDAEPLSHSRGGRTALLLSEKEIGEPCGQSSYWVA